VTVSVSTIRRRLLAAGLVTAEPKKRPKSSYVRFEADLPNALWQSDFTHWRLADGTDNEIIAWLDDHSRYALSVTVHHHVTGPIVVDSFVEAGAEQGFPAAVLTDNGLVYTTRFAGGRGGRNQLETTLAALGIEHRHSRPNHPTTCGKVERFHQTLKQWLAKQTPGLDPLWWTR
jgi:transposase InsO family protein